VKIRQSISVTVLILGSVLIVTWATMADDEPSRQITKRKLVKEDIENMMVTLSNWDRWGKNDELGTLNLITPEKRKQAAALVKDGVAVSLARNVIKSKIDGSPAFVHKMLKTGLSDDEIGSAGDEYSVQYHGFTQTHMDALCHLFYKGKMYNGFSQREVTEKGAGKLSVHQIKQGVFTRGILMDMPRLFGVNYLKGSRAIYPKDLEAWEKKSGVKVGSGDVVLINTGRWARRKAEGEWDIMQNSAGLHATCLPWLKKRDVAIVGSDLALDVLPSGVEGFELPVHWVVVVAMGMPILDNCDFEAISKEANTRKRWSFLLTVSPLAVEGGTGSPVNPVAIF
jgi:kynurenine formamidase